MSAEVLKLDLLRYIVNQWRFFVTAVLLITMGQMVACNTKSRDLKREDVRLGAEKMARARIISAELESKYSLPVAKSNAGRADWSRLSKVRRNNAKELLAEYVSLLSGVLQLDAKKGIYVDHKDILIAWRDRAFDYQKSLEDFERAFGENYEPKLLTRGGSLAGLVDGKVSGKSP
ncbi:MAG: hypothetical protein HC902_10170 [Calothrix sp. SM1_5_4]|nr:hypothetical protein [Calothrix sp. SM1_5_4]